MPEELPSLYFVRLCVVMLQHLDLWEKKTETVNFVQVLDLENFERSTALRHAIDVMLGLIASYEYLTSSFLCTRYIASCHTLLLFL